ncbi:hypothetical protein D3C75_718460 [compost metagenome]
MNGHPDNKTADQVDQQDDNAGNRVSLDEFTCSIHGPEEVSFTFNVTAAFSRLLFVDHPCVQIGIDTHLFAGHRIQCKACTYLSNTFRTFGNYYELDNDQNQKHNESDGNLPSGDPATEGCHDLTRMTIRENQFGS